MSHLFCPGNHSGKLLLKVCTYLIRVLEACGSSVRSGAGPRTPGLGENPVWDASSTQATHTHTHIHRFVHTYMFEGGGRKLENADETQTSKHRTCSYNTAQPENIQYGITVA